MHDAAASSHNPVTSPSTVSIDLAVTDGPEFIWFELVLDRPLITDLYIGANEGSRFVTQTLRLSLSDTFCPFGDLAALAERAATGCDLPFSFEIDHEGPVSDVCLRFDPVRGLPIFEVRSHYDPVVYFAAVVDPRQVGMSLAHAMRAAIHDPANHEYWIDWAHYGGDAFSHFGNAWLRDVINEKHLPKGWHYPDIDHANRDRYKDRP